MTGASRLPRLWLPEKARGQNGDSVAVDLVRLVRRERWESIAPDIGWTLGKPQDTLAALGAYALVAIAASEILKLVPPQLLQG